MRYAYCGALEHKKLGLHPIIWDPYVQAYIFYVGPQDIYQINVDARVHGVELLYDIYYAMKLMRNAESPLPVAGGIQAYNNTLYFYYGVDGKLYSRWTHQYQIGCNFVPGEVTLVKREVEDSVFMQELPKYVQCQSRDIARQMLLKANVISYVADYMTRGSDCTDPLTSAQQEFVTMLDCLTNPRPTDRRLEVIRDVTGLVRKQDPWGCALFGLIPPTIRMSLFEGSPEWIQWLYGRIDRPRSSVPHCIKEEIV